MSQIVEMVKFSLLDTANEQEFITAAERSQQFVKSLPGFLYRSLSHNEETNVWTDTVYWQSMEEAKSAGEQFMACEDCQPLMSLINPESVDMTHQVIKMNSCEG
ncbi:hypothetical protein J4N42_20130 [Vibrio sp. SCSIO 43135]|uniref:Antibiotic biosynthesis monooxygenase n=1 Tax=Vibrio paucivorans TaxID=2829489 RepID=A0A9X3CEG2_9VIBR|nr:MULTISPECIES: hypothetical protein [Vibrio]MCW8334155.1 hypothetical protein [Vibrio paucivorans]USD42920.1 hypothetical protein J4N42_20130 [Vibrio sp. SCSIO 43135]